MPSPSGESEAADASKTAAVSVDRDGKSPAFSLPESVDRFYSSLERCVITGREKNGGKDEQFIIKTSNCPPN